MPFELEQANTEKKLYNFNKFHSSNQHLLLADHHRWSVFYFIFTTLIEQTPIALKSIWRRPSNNGHIPELQHDLH